MIHLDTSFLIRALVPGTDEDSALRGWLSAGVPLGMSAVSWTEFLCGPLEEPQLRLVRRILREIVPFGPEGAVGAARLFNRSGRRRGTLADCMIAASALHASAPLATANPADFHRFLAEGLELAFPGN